MWDGQIRRKTLIGTFCSNNKPKILFTTQNTMLMDIHISGFANKFSFSWKAIDLLCCQTIALNVAPDSYIKTTRAYNNWLGDFSITPDQVTKAWLNSF
jgi:hypothetical protein